jgi:acyl carrier protein
MILPQKLIDFINELRQPLPSVTDPDEALQMESLEMLRLVTFLETEFGFMVKDEQLVPENFVNLRAIAQLLEGKGITMI